MNLKVTIDGARLLDTVYEEATKDSIWEAFVDPGTLEHTFGAPSSRKFGPGLLIVEEMDQAQKQDDGTFLLSFEPSKAHLVNLSPESWVLIALGGHSSQYGMGDQKFLADLPAELTAVGRRLLESVRSVVPGDLRFYERARRYVDDPDNWWTVKPQPVAKSFQITVRWKPPQNFRGDDECHVSWEGEDLHVKPHDEVAESEIICKPDRGSYYRFLLYVKRADQQMFAVLKVLTWAAEQQFPVPRKY